MSLKEAADKLLRIADDIDKEAAEVTQFVCSDCNHTATLATINNKRREAAENSEKNVEVNPITVNDNVACPACGGTMSYQATEESSRYYIDPEKQAGDDNDNDDDDDDDGNNEDKSANEPVDYDSLERYSSSK